MLKRILIAGGLVAAGGLGSAVAQGTFTAWGHEFTLSPFQAQTLETAVATDRATGRRLMIVKMKGGRMMALVSPQRMQPVGEMGEDDPM
ncbi:hypothetical protein OPKNFCMD_0208 [Methylobacterium crusticola]|uniref:Copper chaperone PCu(A)C n=1 Tax=Methylobacterium crusticola TaxID=1697972 RepID=A0ABQ4QRT4_9HYPH|nr:hypothetical protein [Methylobacterium crusticola]GJD47500.1 hypothetical protein OPKNFCMD_0208 [Methylobacterium crusticola]